MPSVLVNAAGAVSGGGRVATLAILGELVGGGARGITWTLLVPRDVVEQYGVFPSDGVRLRAARSRSALGRLAWEQTVLPIRHLVGSHDVLVSAGNLAPLAVSRRSVVMARNAVHFGGARAGRPEGVRYQLEAVIARASVRRVQVTLAATAAMADLVEGRTARRPIVNRFGPGVVSTVAHGPPGRTLFLHRTHWGPHKRFGDVLLAVQQLASSHEGRFLVRSACDPHTDFARCFRESRRERELLAHPAIAAHVELASFPPDEGGAVTGDAVVMPSTTESFCFPLAEATALGLPIVAADSPFARELCGDAALYVPPGDPDALADGMRSVIEGTFAPGARKARILSWSAHVDRLAALCRVLASRR